MKQEVVEAILDDLASGLWTSDPEPAVMRSRWAKDRTMLAGTAQFSELVEKISGRPSMARAVGSKT